MNARDELLREMVHNHLYMTDERATELLDAYRTEVLAEVTTWLVKKAREFRAAGETVQADTAAALASKIERGAVRANNLRMLPADFFEPDHTYTDSTGYTAPEITTYFRVEHVTRHPDRGHLRAIGWSRTGEPGAKWHGDFRDEGEFDGWIDITGEAS